MLDERVLYLINAELDGELRPQEQAELESALSASAEARTVQAALRKLASLMEAMPAQEPPVGLANRIVAQIRLPSRRAVAAPKFSLAGLLSSFQPVQAGMAFAAGLLLTVGLYEARQPGGESVDLSQLVGAMVATPGGSAAQTQQKDRLSITGPGVSGTVSLGEIGEYVVLSFDLELAQQTEIKVGLAEAGLGFGGIAHASAVGLAAGGSYEVLGGTLRVVNQGRQVFTVFLPEVAGTSAGPVPGQLGGREISIGVSTNGARLFSGVLRG